MILPAPKEPLPRPTDHLAIHSLEAQRLRCLQPFRTQDMQGRPFLAEAQESLDVLLRHPSGRANRNLGPSESEWTSGSEPLPHLTSHTGWWLVENEDLQTAWFPAPYLEEVVLGQGKAGLTLGTSGMSPISFPMTASDGSYVARVGQRKHLSQREEVAKAQSVLLVPTARGTSGAQRGAHRKVGL